jgi:hypothetical protein
MGVLLYLKWKEGRLTLFGKGSAAYHRRIAVGATPSAPPVDSPLTGSEEEEQEKSIELK